MEQNGESVDIEKKYLDEMGSYPLLSIVEERELGQILDANREGHNRVGLIYHLGHVVASRELVNEAATFLEDSQAWKRSPNITPMNNSRYLNMLMQIVEVGTDPKADWDKLVAQELAYALAKERFILSNLRLVVSIAKRFPPMQHVKLLDRIQDGNFGLQHAVDLYDWKKGRFSTYATDWIHKYIENGLDENESLISSVPKHSHSALRRKIGIVNINTRRILDFKKEYKLSDEETTMYVLIHPLHLDSQVSSDSNDTLIDFLPSVREEFNPEAQIEVQGRTELIGELLAGLRPLNRFIVEARTGLFDGDEWENKKIASRIGISRERVDAVYDESLGKMYEVLIKNYPEFV